MQLKLKTDKNNPKYPRKAARYRDCTVKIRVTKAFKNLLAKESKINRSVHRKYWSESDILHRALACYMQNESLNWHLLTPTEQMAVRDLMDIGL